MRGAILLAAAPGEYTSKPRPFLVVQSDIFNEAHPSLTVCPVTSVLLGQGLYRIPLASTGTTGLLKSSEAQVDKVQTIRRGRVTEVIGRAPAFAMDAIDSALRRWLDL